MKPIGKEKTKYSKISENALFYLRNGLDFI